MSAGLDRRPARWRAEAMVMAHAKPHLYMLEGFWWVCVPKVAAVSQPEIDALGSWLERLSA